MLEAVIDEVRTGAIVRPTPEQLTALLARTKLVQEADTYFNDMIRILELGDLVLVQETADAAQLLVRSMATVADARALVADRLDTYERMWDGCGCRIRYFDR